MGLVAPRHVESGPGTPCILNHCTTTEVSHMYSYLQGWIVLCGPDPNLIWKNFFKKII